MSQQTTIANCESEIILSRAERQDTITIVNGTATLTGSDGVVLNTSSACVSQQVTESYPVISVSNNQATIQTVESDTVIVANNNQVTINVAAGVLSNNTDANPYSFVEAGESIPLFRVCYVRGDQAFVASNDMAIAYANLIQGIAVSTANEGDLVQIQLAEKIYNSEWNFTKGKPVFLGTNGNVTQTPPQSGLLCELGLAVDNSMLFLDIEEPTNLG